VKLSRVNLLKTLSILGNAVGNKVMVIADFVKISYSSESGRLSMSTTDYNAFINVDHGEVDGGDQSFDLLIDYKKFANIVRCSTTDNVDITDKGEYVRVKTNGTYKFEKWSEIEDFPSADFTSEDLNEFEATKLSSAWSKTVIAVSKDIGKLSFQGVNYDGAFAATDNRRLSCFQIAGDRGGQLPPVLLPPTSGSIISQCRGNVSIGVSTNGKALVIVSPENSMLASIRILDASFPDYRKFTEGAFEKGSGTIVSLSLSELMGACERMQAFTDNDSRTFNLEVHGGENPSVKMHAQHKGAAEESVDASLNGNYDDFMVSNNTYMLDHFMTALGVLDSEAFVRFIVKDNGMMWIKESRSGGDEYLHLLQPVTT
jgi:DNA polymerase III sliding clamp (beta) subunit (PCNA family)